MSNTIDRRDSRRRRKIRIRKKISGTARCPRLTVFRSVKHLYAQLIDDETGRTLAAVATVEKVVKSDLKSYANRAAAKKIGQIIAERAKEKNVTKVVFDRSGFKFHGVVKAIADSARAGGLEF